MEGLARYAPARDATARYFHACEGEVSSDGEALAAAESGGSTLLAREEHLEHRVEVLIERVVGARPTATAIFEVADGVLDDALDTVPDCRREVRNAVATRPEVHFGEVQAAESKRVVKDRRTAADVPVRARIRLVECVLNRIERPESTDGRVVLACSQVVLRGLDVQELPVETKRVHGSTTGDVGRSPLAAVGVVVVPPLCVAAGVGDIGNRPERIAMEVEGRRRSRERDGSERTADVAPHGGASRLALQDDLRDPEDQRLRSS